MRTRQLGRSAVHRVAPHVRILVSKTAEESGSLNHAPKDYMYSRDACSCSRCVQPARCFEVCGRTAQRLR